MELVNGLVEYDKKQFADPYGNGVQRFDKLTKYVDMAVKGLGDNTSSAIDVAKALYYIREEKLYEDYPVPGTNGVSVFKDFNSFCKEVFKCRKSTIYNYIALYERFGSDSANKTVSIPSNVVSSYTYTQLVLMSSLSDAELLQVKPNWTCSQIKNYVEDIKEKKILNSNRLENNQEVDEVVEVVEDVRYKSYKLDTFDNCKEFLKTYSNWDKVVEFKVDKSVVNFYQIQLSDIMVVAYTSDNTGIYEIGVGKALFYIFSVGRYYEGLNLYFSALSKLNIEGASALLSSLPVEFAEVRV